MFLAENLNWRAQRLLLLLVVNQIKKRFETHEICSSSLQVIKVTGYDPDAGAEADVLNLEAECRSISKSMKVLGVNSSGSLCVPSSADLAPARASAAVISELDKIREARLAL